MKTEIALTLKLLNLSSLKYSCISNYSSCAAAEILDLQF